MILAVIGLVTLLLALVLGTLVGNTYAFFATQKSELETFASRALLFDQSLAEYGPEAKPIRDEFKKTLTESYELFWKGAELDPSQLKVDVPISPISAGFRADKGARGQDPRADRIGRRRQGQSGLDGADAAVDVAAKREPDRVAAGDHRRRLGGVFVLRVRRAFRHKSDDDRGARRRGRFPSRARSI